jgi:very-short-patch-repair endonuclease
MKMTELPAEIRERLDDYRQRKIECLDDEMQRLADLVAICESPLEQVLFVELAEVFHAAPAGTPEDRHLRGFIAFPNVDRFSVAIRQQQSISTRKRNYRADFLVTLEDWNWELGRHEQLVKIAVEVDGHDFHEKTKQQAQYDKFRDRAMVAEGYKVLRFTGSEVYRDSEDVVTEIEDLLTTEANKLLA